MNLNVTKSQSGQYIMPFTIVGTRSRLNLATISAPFSPEKQQRLRLQNQVINSSISLNLGFCNLVEQHLRRRTQQSWRVRTQSALTPFSSTLMEDHALEKFWTRNCTSSAVKAPPPACRSRPYAEFAQIHTLRSSPQSSAQIGKFNCN